MRKPPHDWNNLLRRLGLKSVLRQPKKKRAERRTSFETLEGRDLLALGNTISIAAINSPVPEGSDAHFLITVTGARTQNVVVSYATSPGTAVDNLDYTATSGSVTISAGSSTAMVAVPTVDDSLDEPNETFSLNITSAPGATITNGTAPVTINDGDNPPMISIDDATPVNEGGNAQFTVSLSAVSGKDVTFTYQTADGTATAGDDYTGLPAATVTIPAGETSAPITVVTLDDAKYEDPENFVVNLSNLINANPADVQGTGTIGDNDNPPVVNLVSAPDVDEGNVAIFTVSLTAISGLDVWVNFYTVDGTATAGEDFTGVPIASAVTIHIPAGTISVPVYVPTTHNTKDENNETFNGYITTPVTNATLGTTGAYATILDIDAPPTLTLTGPAELAEGANGTYTVTLSQPSDFNVVVTYSTDNDTALAGEDFTAANGTLTFFPGDTSKTFTVQTTHNTKDEPNEVFVARVSSTTSSAFVNTTILDIDNPPAPLLTGPGTIEEGASGTYTVTLTEESAFPVVVTYATSDDSALAGQDYTAATGTLTFNPGDGPKTFTVQTTHDSKDEPDRVFVTTLSSSGNSDVVTNTTIQDNDNPPTISLSLTELNPPVAGSPVVEGTAVQFTVTLSDISSFPVSFTYSTADGTALSVEDYDAANGISLTVDPGSLTKPFTVGTINNAVVEPTEDFTVTLGDNPYIATGTVTATILDDDYVGPLPVVSISGPSPVLEGNNAVFMLSLSFASSTPVTVEYRTLDGTALASEDYTLASQWTSITFPVNVTSLPITIATTQDSKYEDDETFYVDLNLPTSTTNATLGTTSASATITDNDYAPTLSVSGPSPVNEGDLATFTVTVSTPSGKDITFAYWTIDGTAVALEDYTAIPDGFRTIPANTPFITFTVPTTDDSLDEEDSESFSVQIATDTSSNATVAVGSASASILDNDLEPEVSIADAGTLEEGTDATFVVTLSQPSGRTITVQYKTDDGTAKSDHDYTEVTSGTVDIPAGETTANIVITTIDDERDEPDETFSVILESADHATVPGATNTGTATLTDNDSPPTISITVGEPVAEGTAVQFTISLSNKSGYDITVDYATSDGSATAGSDYTATTGTATIDAGETSFSFTVATLPDTVTPEPDETFTATLSNPSSYVTLGTPDNADGIILDVPSGVPYGPVEKTEPEPPCECTCENDNQNNNKKTGVSDKCNNKAKAEVKNQHVSYNGANDTPNVTIQNNVQLSPTAGNATSITVSLTVDGVTLPTVYYSPAGVTGGASYNFNLQIPVSLIPADVPRSNFMMTVTENYSGQPSIPNVSAGESWYRRPDRGGGQGVTLIDTEYLTFDGLGNATIEEHNGRNLLLKTDGQGGFFPDATDTNKTTLAPTAAGFEARTLDGTVRTFSALGLLIVMRARNGQEIRYQYIDADQNGVADQLSKVVQPTGDEIVFAYDSTGVLASITEPGSRVTNYTHDPVGHLTSIIDPDPDGTGPTGRPTTTFTFDPVTDYLKTVTDPTGIVTEYEYNSTGQVIRTLKNGAAVEELDSAIAVNVVEVGTTGTASSPASMVATSGRATTKTDAMGRERREVVDRNNRPVQKVDPGVTTVQISYRDDGNVGTVSADPEGNGPLATSYAYDAHGNQTQATHPDGSIETWTYHPILNLPLSHTDVRGFETLYTLDQNTGNVQVVREVVGLVDDPLNGETNDVVTQFVYTPGGVGLAPPGLLERITDALGHVTEMRYDTRGNLTRVTYALGTALEAFVEYTYNSANEVLTVVDELGRTTTNDYDGVGRLIATVLPDPDGSGLATSPITTYEYDASSRLRKETDPLGRVTEYIYNARGWLAEVLRPDHDNDGNLTVTQYDYNAAGEIESITDPLGRVTTYLYDGFGRQDRVALPGPNGTYDSLLSPVQRVVFDALGQVIQQIDPLGNVTKFATNILTRTATLEGADPDGFAQLLAPISTLIYDAAGNAETSIDPLGRTTTTTYDRWNRPLTVMQPDPDGPGQLAAPVTTYEYDKVGNLRFVTDPLGNVTEFQYDARNRRIATLQPDPDDFGPQTKPTTLFIFDDASQQTGVIDPLGRIVIYAYDDLGRQTAVTGADPDGLGPQSGPVTLYTYDAANRMTSITDPNGNVTIYGYDLLYHRTSVTQPDPDGMGGVAAPVSTFVFDAVGQLLSQTDPLGRTTTFHYDSLGRRDSVTQPDPDGNNGPLFAPVTTFTFDLAGNLITTTDANGSVTTNVYDHLLRRILVVGADPDGSGPQNAPVTSYGYDAASQLVSMTDPLNRVTLVGYDLLGRRISETQPDPDGGGSQTSPITTFTYDAVGNLKTTTDPLGKVTTNVYDNLYRLLETQQPDPDGSGPLAIPTTVYAYDDVGNRLSLTDPVGNLTAWTYDGLNRVSTQTNQLGYTWQFRYDAVGNLLQKTDRRDRVISYEYDHLDRRTDERWFEATGSTAVIGSLHYQYDIASQLLSVGTTDIRDGQTLSRANYYTYDNLGRTISETQNPGLGAPAQFDSTYDPVGMRLSIQAGLFENSTLQADYKNEYTYDALHRLTQLTQHGVSGGNSVTDKRFDFTYNTAGQFTSLTRYASLSTSDLVATTSYNYDAIGRLTDLHHQQGSTSLARYQYDYDAHSRITSIDSLLDGVSTYNYDNTDQLTDADHSSTSQSDEAYSYDENGNRTMNGHVVGANNQLLSDGEFVYTYDAEGNRQSKTKITTAERTEYSWDNRNRLIRVVEKAPGVGVPNDTGWFYGSASGSGYQAFVSTGGEASGSGYVYFSLFSAATEPVTISYWSELETAVNGADYQLTPGEVTIPVGQSNAYFSFPITDDTIPEGTERFSFRFRKVGETTPNRLSVPIYDNDVIGGSASGSASGYSYGSAYGSAMVSVSASGSGSSYGYSSGSGLFAAWGSGSGNSYGYLSGGNGLFRVPASAVNSWSYNYLSQNGLYAYAGNGGEASQYGYWGFYLNQAATEPVTIDYWIENETAVEGQDFQFPSGSATIPVGQWGTYGNFTVTDDSFNEGTESFKIHFHRQGMTEDLSLSMPIVDNDTTSSTVMQSSYFSASAYSYTEGTPVSLTVYTNTLYYDANLTVTLIPVTASTGTDLPAGSLTFTMPAGSYYGNFSIPTLDDSVIEGDEQFILRLQFTGMDSMSDAFDIPLTLFDNDTIPTEVVYFSAYASASTEGSPVDVGIYVYRPYPATVYAYLASDTATAGDDFSSSTYSFTIPAYSGYANISIPTFDDSIYEGTEHFKVVYYFMDSYSSSTMFEIPLDLFDNEITTNMSEAMFSAYANSSVEGSPIYLYTSLWTNSYLALNHDATLTISLIPVTASHGSDIPAETYTRTFYSGSYWGSDYFSIPTFDDAVYEGTEQFIVRLQFTGMYSSSAVFEIPLELFDNEQPPQWTTQVDYYYDDENRLIARQEQHSTQPQLNSTQAFYYDRGQVVLETKDGALADRLVWGPNVDQLLADEQLDWTNPSTPELEVLWPLGDHLNSNRDLAVYDSLTQTTVIANHIIYDSFGNLISQTDSTFVTEWRWTGRWFDSTTGLQNNLNRWYDPKIGQWVSEDPIGFDAGDANIRRYASNLPISLFDPDGLTEQCGSILKAVWMHMTHWHHLLDQAIFTDDFLKKHNISNVDINTAEFGWFLKGQKHSELHAAGWSDDWNIWIKNMEEKGKKIDKDAIVKQLEVMKMKYKEIIATGKQADMSYDIWRKGKEARKALREALENTISKARKLKSCVVPWFDPIEGMFELYEIITDYDGFMRKLYQNGVLIPGGGFVPPQHHPIYNPYPVA